MDNLLDVAYCGEDDLRKLYRAAYKESPRTDNQAQLTSHKVISSVPSSPRFGSPVLSSARQQSKSFPGTHKMPDLEPLCRSLHDRKAAPVPEVCAGRTEKTLDMSPITTCSMGTSLGSPTRDGQIKKMKELRTRASKMRWASLFKVPDLDNSQHSEQSNERQRDENGTSPKNNKAEKFDRRPSLTDFVKRPSGYISTISNTESDDVSIFIDDFENCQSNADAILHEIENFSGSMSKLLDTKPLECSATSINLEQSTSNSIAFDLEKSRCKSSPYSKKRTVARNTQTAADVSFEQFIEELTIQYGQTLQLDLVIALKKTMVVSGHVEDDGIEYSLLGGKKTSPRRHNSIDSNVSLDSSLTSDASLLSDWSDDDEEALDDDEDDDEDDQDPPILIVADTLPAPTPPPSAASPLAPDSLIGGSVCQIGRYLSRGVKLIYNKKLPKELKYVLANSTGLQAAMNTDEELDIIQQEFESACGSCLPADLLLALREASVTLRTPSSSKRTRKSLVTRSSSTVRTVSRSSGMPSIQEKSDEMVVDMIWCEVD